MFSRCTEAIDTNIFPVLDILKAHLKEPCLGKDGGLFVTKKACTRLKKLIHEYLKNTPEPSQLTPKCNGGIRLEWLTGNKYYANLTVEEDGTISAELFDYKKAGEKKSYSGKKSILDFARDLENTINEE